MYKLSKNETETHIRWDAEEKVAHIFTCDPIYIRKLDKLCNECSEYKVVRRESNPDSDSVFYEVPAKLISFRTPSTRTYTEEQKAVMRERLIAVRERKYVENT